MKQKKNMRRFTYDITIEAENEQDAMTMLKASAILMKKLRPNELKKLAEVVENDPAKIAFAKKALGL